MILLIIYNLLNFVNSQNCYPFSTLSINHKFLIAHNEFRNNHDSPPLRIDFKLIGDSVNWSKHLAKDVHFLKHSGQNNYGENLWLLRGSRFFHYKITDSIIAWYDEYKNFSFENPHFSKNTAHFAQMIWKGTDRLGCGVCTEDDSTYITCRYQPRGNIEGQFMENVPPIAVDIPQQRILDVAKRMLYVSLFFGTIIFLIIFIIILHRWS